MNYYPITIPTLCRFEHFKRCVESLSFNTYAENTELIIGLDYPLKEEHKKGYNQILEYIPKIKGFKKVTLFKRERNYGASANILALREYAFSKYDACILSEDDNEFSPCFLDFMNQALEKYKNEIKIVSICGYTAIDYENTKNKELIFLHDSCAWGIGIWKDKEINSDDMTFYDNLWISPISFWSVFFTAPAITYMFATMMSKKDKWGDVMRTISNIKKRTYQVRPYKSLVRNWGYDGSGLHCTGKDDSKCKQEILADDTYKDNFNKLIKNSLPFSTQFFYLLPKNRIKALYNIAKMGLSCLKMRSNIKYNFI